MLIASAQWWRSISKNFSRRRSIQRQQYTIMVCQSVTYQMPVVINISCGLEDIKVTLHARQYSKSKVLHEWVCVWVSWDQIVVTHNVSRWLIRTDWCHYVYFWASMCSVDFRNVSSESSAMHHWKLKNQWTEGELMMVVPALYTQASKLCLACSKKWHQNCMITYLADL